MSVPLAAMSMIPQNVTALPLRIFPMTGSAPAVKKDKRQVQQSIGPDLAEMSLYLPLKRRRIQVLFNTYRSSVFRILKLVNMHLS